MELKNNKFRILIVEDEKININSSIVKDYDYVHNPNNYTDKDFIKTFSIEIWSKNGHTKIALVGDLHSSVDGCAIMEDTLIHILQNDTLSTIDLLTTKVLHSTNIDTFGCNFSIYPIETGYIIYGEIEIIKLTFDFTVEWRFSARDIFVSIYGRNAFELCSDRIKLYDFQDNYYEIDLNGKLICDIAAE